MGKRDRILPPGPNPREDMPKEKDNRQLREHLRQRRAGEEGTGTAGDIDGPSQAEGERQGEPATKVAGTPGQAEGERGVTEEEIRRREEKDRR